MLLQRKKDEAILPSFTELFLCCCCLCVCVCVSGLGLVVFFFFMFFFCDVIIGFFISKMGRNSAWETPDFYGWPVSLKKKRKIISSMKERQCQSSFKGRFGNFVFFFSCPFIVCVCVESFERKKNDSIFGRRNHQRNEIIFRKSSKKMWSSFFLKKRKWFSISKKKNNRRIANEIEWGGRGLPLFKKKKNTFLALGTALFFCLFFF